MILFDILNNIKEGLGGESNEENVKRKRIQENVQWKSVHRHS